MLGSSLRRGREASDRALTKAQDPGQRRRVESAIKAANRADGYDSSSDDDDALGARVGGRAAIRAKVSVCPMRVLAVAFLSSHPSVCSGTGAGVRRRVPSSAASSHRGSACQGGERRQATAAGRRLGRESGSEAGSETIGSLTTHFTPNRQAAKASRQFPAPPLTPRPRPCLAHHDVRWTLGLLALPVTPCTQRARLLQVQPAPTSVSLARP